MARDRPSSQEQNDLVGALSAFRESLNIYRSLTVQEPTNAKWHKEFRQGVSMIGGLAYRLVLVRKFSLALEVADQAIALAPDMIWLSTNRAHALMFLGRTEEARSVYERYRGEKNEQGDKSWETGVLEDFAEIRKAGLTNPLMDEIDKQFTRKK